MKFIVESERTDVLQTLRDRYLTSNYVRKNIEKESLHPEKVLEMISEDHVKEYFYPPAFVRQNEKPQNK